MDAEGRATQEAEAEKQNVLLIHEYSSSADDAAIGKKDNLEHVKKVYSSDNYIMAGHVHSLLEANNIDCHLRNMNLTGGIGELPINECWPEVWVNDEIDFDSAESLIKTALSPAKQNDPWKCQCGELIEGQFELCWSCGNERNS